MPGRIVYRKDRSQLMIPPKPAKHPTLPPKPANPTPTNTRIPQSAGGRSRTCNVSLDNAGA